MKSNHVYNGKYSGKNLDYLAFPLGGIGAGMFCVEGTGNFSHVSMRNAPNISAGSPMFAAISVRGQQPFARVLEGQLPTWKIFGLPATGNGGLGGAHFGLPRFAQAEFLARFPFATVTLEDPMTDLAIELTTWSPFTPGDADSSCMPWVGLEYRFINRGKNPLDAIFSFHAWHLMKVEPQPNQPALHSVAAVPGGFVLQQAPHPEQPWTQGAFCVETDAPGAISDCAWHRSGWFDTNTMLWNAIQAGMPAGNRAHAEPPASPGASLYVPIKLAAGTDATITLRVSWYVPESKLSIGVSPADNKCCQCGVYYKPWYAAQFADIQGLAAAWKTNYHQLRARSADFSNCFYDTSLPPEVVEAIAANLTILKSPTVLRQQDGRLWGWEGCCDSVGCCSGSCTHVWNYAQALAHLFPDLERSFRQTEFNEDQNAEGHQQFRSLLPIRENNHDYHAAADGQLGGIMKVHRDWRVCGDTAWLRSLWPKVKTSMDYCIRTWDPDRQGTLSEPHHNTYDIEFWGPDGMCTSFYLGALLATATMAEALGEDASAYRKLARKAEKAMLKELFNGEYFEQQVTWHGLRATPPDQSAPQNISPEALALLKTEGPNHQYGTGCLSDGVLGIWMAAVCGLGHILHRGKVTKHLRSVFRYNLIKDLRAHSNPQRPGFALGQDGGLLLCSWPRGGKPSLPFVYSDEVWTGIEYQVASHLMMMGRVREGLAIVRAARDRYDGRIRNPFNEYECGHWYARAMSSYALLQGLTGARYDAVEKVLYLCPQIEGDFRAFLATASGYGSVGMRDGKPYLDVKHGSIPVERIEVLPKK